MSRLKKKLFMAVFLLSSIFTFGETKELLGRNEEWKYSDIGIVSESWRQNNFNDSTWKIGKSPLGYGDEVSETDPSIPIGTAISFGKDDDKYITSYFRKEIEVKNLNDIKELEVFLHVDDGAVIYINGVEAFRKGMNDEIVGYNSVGKFKAKEETFIISKTLLKEGKNLICSEVHQDGPTSSDLWFELGIKAVLNDGIKSDTAKIDLKEEKKSDTIITAKKISKITVTFTGDTKTTKGFAWYTSLDSKKSDLQIVEKKSNIADFSNPIKFKGTTTIPTNSKNEYFHKAEAINLKSGISYFFRVGDESLNLWSDTGIFTTSNKDNKFTFIDYADTQAKSEDEAILSGETLKSALDTVKNAEFVVHNGDLVDVGMTEIQWDWLLGHSQSSLLKTTIAPIAGNHEEEKDAFIEHFNIKEISGSDTKTGAYYSYDYENTHFIMLNTNEDSKEYNNFSEEQLEWMKKDIKESKQRGMKWIIVTIHKGPYTTSNHATDTDIMGENGLRTKVAPIFSDLGVDLVLQGHDHGYARTKPINNGKAVETNKTKELYNGEKIEYAINPKGTIYMIPATGGPKVYYKNKKIDSSYYELFDKADEHNAAKYGNDSKDKSRPIRGIIQNFAEISVDNNKLSVVVYEIDQNTDKKPYIIDSFGIIKK